MQPQTIAVPLLVLLLLFPTVCWVQADDYVGSLETMRALTALASPLLPSATLTLLSLSQGGNLQFCAASVEGAQAYCAKEARVRGIGLGSGVCILLLFDYDYRGQTCSGTSLINTTIQASFSTTFFSPNFLTYGRIVHLPKEESFGEDEKARFLPQNLGRSLKFDASHLQELMKMYGVSQGTYMESYMNATLSHCSLPPSPHETSACHTSLESMESFIGNTLGPNFVALRPTQLPSVKAQVLKANFINDENQKVISCHTMKFPSLVYTCHMVPKTRVVTVSLRPLTNGTTTSGTTAVCHLDTSYWNPNHVAFKALHTQPGKGTICHWLPHNSFIFVERSPLARPINGM